MEILVCLLVMSVIVIGASGLLLQSQRLSRHSAMSAQAAMLAADLAQLLRVAAQGGSSGFGLASSSQLDLRPAELSRQAAPADCLAQSCNREQALAFELRDWARRAHAVLPNARVVICRDGNPWDAAGTRLNWDCKNVDTAAVVVKLGWHSPFAPDDELAAPQLALLAE